MMTHDHIRRAIEAAFASMVEAFMSGNLRAIADFYTDDAMLILYRHGKFRPPIVGRGAIEALWTNLPGGISWKLEVTEITGNPRMPCQLGKSIMRNRVDGEEYLSNDDIMLIWQQQPDGSYKIYADMTIINSEEVPPTS
jgi:ketosteroid isomerase-like protein